MQNAGDVQSSLDSLNSFGHAETFLTGQFGAETEVFRAGATSTASGAATSVIESLAVPEGAGDQQKTVVDAVLPRDMVPMDKPPPHSSRALGRTHSEELEAMPANS